MLPLAASAEPSSQVGAGVDDQGDAGDPHNPAGYGPADDQALQEAIADGFGGELAEDE